MIKTIIFDVGGILVPEKGDLIKEEIADLLGITKTEFLSLLKDFQSKATKGEIKLLDVYSEIIKNIKSDARPEELFEKHISVYKETSTTRDPEILSLIEKLKSKYSVIALTNTETEIGEFNKQNGLFDCFDKAYLSTEIGLMKPQPEIYLKILEDLNHNPDEVLFIDDKEKYVTAAENLKIKSILYENPEQLKKELNLLKII